VKDFISKTVSAFRSSPNSSDAEIHRMLVADGIKPAVAARLVEFVPMAYCRLLLERSGARFPDTFRRLLPDGRLSAEKRLSSEPIWDVVSEFARNEARVGISSGDLLVVAGRSAEFDAANRLLNKGANLKDVAFTSVVLTWTEDGPVAGC
jgi:hypothetical protein